MGLKLVDLLRWSKSVELKGPDGKTIVKDGKPVIVWTRIIGDLDLEESYKLARVASAKVRATLKDKHSDDFMSKLASVYELDDETCKTIIDASRRRDFNNAAYANVERPELPKIDEVAVDPDAPTLEEQERLDRLVSDVNTEFAKQLEDYVQTKVTELQGELNAMNTDELREAAILSLVEVAAIEAFVNELEVQKIWRAVYLDKYFKERAFDSADEYRQLDATLKEQLIAAYNSIEPDSEEIKN